MNELREEVAKAIYNSPIMEMFQPWETLSDQSKKSYYDKADIILSHLRQYLEEKMPKARVIDETYEFNSGYNFCLAEIRTIIEGIK